MKRATSIILLFIANLLGLVYLLPKLSTRLFLLEFIAIAFFMLLFVFSLYSFFFKLKSRFMINAVFFIFGLINTVLLYFFIKSFMVVLLTAANAFGLVIAINSISAKKPKKPKVIIEELKPEEKKKDEERIISDIKKELEDFKRKKELEEIKREAKTLSRAEREVEKIKKTYAPGKFVGSSTSNKYHSPKCDWAKKIKKKNQVWFKTEMEARRKGYSKHSCLKK
jgi:hypothetical protein